ncbi:MAG: hypothetical protein J6W56_06810 [Prevotella sp.]|nr:hypothetical protein [Prevotella sp.]
MNEEKYIEERVGKRNPFRVPDGYFDQFPEQFMSSLPEHKPRAKSIWLRPVFYAAASICALFICAGVWLALPEKSQETPAMMATVQQDTEDTAFDEAVDYLMMDNHDIYAYLADY